MSTANVQQRVAESNRSRIADSTGLNRGYVSQVLNGKREPGIGVAKLLAKDLGLTLDEFYSWWKAASSN